MADSSDEDTGIQETRDGRVSPRTLLAIQQALAEEDDDITESRTLSVCSATKPQPPVQRPAPRLVISSSEDETEADKPPRIKALANEDRSGLGRHLPDHAGRAVDCLLVNSSEDEMEEVIGQRTRALHSAAVEPTYGSPDREKEREREAWMKLKEQTKTGESIEADIKVGSGEQTETKEKMERDGAGHEQTVEGIKHDQEDHSGQSIGVDSFPFPVPFPSTRSALLQRGALSGELKTANHPSTSEQRSEESIRALEERNGEVVKIEDSGESDSEGNGYYRTVSLDIKDIPIYHTFNCQYRI